MVTRSQIRLVTERTVEQFMLRLFLRDVPLRSLCLIAPYIDTLPGYRFTLLDVSEKICRERIPTYMVTRQPTEDYQFEAMALLAANPWLEIRYNDAVHAKVFIAHARREGESFALFGSANLTGRAVAANLEVGMLLVAQGIGRPIVEELIYWAHNRVRVLPESRLYKRITGRS